jgi:hypothetical protein
MPYHVGTSDDCPPSKPYAVIKDADGEVMGCHETKEKAEAQLRALYASETKTAKPLKAEQLTNSKWRVLAIPFGGPLKGGKDLDGEFFSEQTDIKPDWFDKRPVLFHHAQDETVKDETLGTEDDLEQEKDGWWATVWLDRANEYWERVNKLLAAGKMYGSSGALGHLVRKDHKSGEILVWPHIEQTLTPTPANPFSRVVPVKALDHFSTAGIAVDAQKRALLTDEDASDLGHDLPQGGDDSAMAKLRANLDQLEEVLARLRG